MEAEHRSGTKPRPRRRRSSRPGLVAAALVTVALTVLGGCGGGNGGGNGAGDQVGAQPQGTSGSFGIAGLSQLDRYPRSRATGPVAHGPGGVLTRSFTVQGAEPDQIFQFFVSTLPDAGWTAVPGGAAAPIVRGAWQQGGKTLVVAVAAAPTVSTDSAGVVSQYSLVLYPPGQQPS